MKKTIIFFKRNKKLFIAFILGIIISGIGIYAKSSYLYNSNEIEFNNTNSNLILNGNSVTNVKDALDSLYEKLNSNLDCNSEYVRGINGLMGYECIQPLTADRLVSDASQLGLENVADAYRYVGADPTNYITFNNELWRIIGVYSFSNKNHLKIVRAMPLDSGQKYNSSTSTNVWNSSSLKTYLNGTGSSQYYYTLSTDAKSIIYEGNWYVGASEYNAVPSTVYTTAKDKTITQKVGLVAEYEYLYASTSDCWSIEGYPYSTSCAEKNWLWNVLTKNKTNRGWLITPSYILTSNALNVNNNSGAVYDNAVNFSYYISPTVYLQSTISIISGDGTLGNPYILEQ